MFASANCFFDFAIEFRNHTVRNAAAGNGFRPGASLFRLADGDSVGNPTEKRDAARFGSGASHVVIGIDLDSGRLRPERVAVEDDPLGCPKVVAARGEDGCLVRHALRPRIDVPREADVELCGIIARFQIETDFGGGGLVARYLCAENEVADRSLIIAGCRRRTG